MENSCERCKALVVSGSSSPCCALGHSIDAMRKVAMESCERPLTYLALIEARKDYLSSLYI